MLSIPRTVHPFQVRKKEKSIIYQWNTSETGDINEEMDLIEYFS